MLVNCINIYKSPIYSVVQGYTNLKYFSSFNTENDTSIMIVAPKDRLAFLIVVRPIRDRDSKSTIQPDPISQMTLYLTGMDAYNIHDM